MLCLEQVELLDEVVVVLEQRVPVGFRVKRRHPVKVVDVNVHEYAEHSGQDFLARPLEVLEHADVHGKAVQHF